MAADEIAGQHQLPPNGPWLARRARPPMLARWSEAAILPALASFQGVLAPVAALDAGFGLVALGLMALAAAVGWIVTVQFAARGIYRLGAQPRALMIREGANWT